MYYKQYKDVIECCNNICRAKGFRKYSVKIVFNLLWGIPTDRNVAEFIPGNEGGLSKFTGRMIVSGTQGQHAKSKIS